MPQQQHWACCSLVWVLVILRRVYCSLLLAVLLVKPLVHPWLQPHAWSPGLFTSLPGVLRLLCCRREKFCDFCNCELPDWKSVLTPTLGSSAPAVMNVNFDNKTYSFHVAPGEFSHQHAMSCVSHCASHLSNWQARGMNGLQGQPGTCFEVLESRLAMWLALRPAQCAHKGACRHSTQQRWQPHSCKSCLMPSSGWQSASESCL